MDTYSDITLIVDRSGSMYDVKEDTIGGIQNVISEQKDSENKCTFSLVFFNEKTSVQIDAEDISKIQTKVQYETSGTTALYDCLGTIIDKTGSRLSKIEKEDRPNRVVFIIITDGQENSSVEYDKTKVINMVRHQKEKYSWEFLYIGADLEDMADGQELRLNCFATSKLSTKENYLKLGKSIKSYIDDTETSLSRELTESSLS